MKKLVYRDMEKWAIQFLGVPFAVRGEEVAHLRSKESWAVLASLMLPAIGNGLPRPVSREKLADRFWSDSDAQDPRANLRQCLSSIRAAFGEECIIADRHDIRIVQGWYTTDIEQAMDAYSKSQSAGTKEARLEWLTEAQRHINGEFFEGWAPEGMIGEEWMIHQRAELRNKLAPIMKELADALEQAGQLNAAFDVARRCLHLHPSDPYFRALTMRLAASTHQLDVMLALEQTQSLQDAVSRQSTLGLASATLRGGRNFSTLFHEELKRLPTARSKNLLRLSFLPAPFPAEIAHQVCAVPLPSLRALIKTPFLSQSGELYMLPAMIRECALKELPSPTRLKLARLLTHYCFDAIYAESSEQAIMCLPFLLSPEGTAFLEAALEWVLKQPPSIFCMRYIDSLRHLHHNELALRGLNYLQEALDDNSQTTTIRCYFALTIAFILMQADDNTGAIPPLLTAIEIATDAGDLVVHASLVTTLMRAYSNIGDWERGIKTGILATELLRKIGNHHSAQHCVRFMGEISFHAGDPEKALELVEEAHLLALFHTLPPDTIADVLFWKGRIYHALGRNEEALEAAEAALAGWEKSGDNYVGFCLTLLGQIHTFHGRYAEAKAHLDHAVVLLKRANRELHRIAAVEALGDLMRAQNRCSEAHEFYVECLTYYNSIEFKPNVIRIQSKVSSV